MSEITNAVNLARDPDFRDWVRVGCCFHARTIIAAGTAGAVRTLAVDTVSNPTMRLDQWINVLAADPALCSVSSTVGDGQDQIGQALLLGQIAATWTALAAVLYPAGQ